MNRYAALYLVTLLVIVPLDFLFLGVVARDFFTSQVGNMLGEIKLAPAILFYLLYVAGSVIFVEANREHRFYDIREELVVLVFFAPAES